MCLAIPARITAIDGSVGTVDVMGVTQECMLDLVPKAKIGDYVLNHAGFAIEIIDEQYAQETLDLIRQFPDLIAGDLAAETNAVESAAPTASPADAPEGV